MTRLNGKVYVSSVEIPFKFKIVTKAMEQKGAGNRPTQKIAVAMVLLIYLTNTYGVLPLCQNLS